MTTRRSLISLPAIASLISHPTSPKSQTRLPVIASPKSLRPPNYTHPLPLRRRRRSRCLLPRRRRLRRRPRLRFLL